MFYDRFLSLCNEKGIKPAKVARDLEINQSTIAMWKSRGSVPNAVMLVNMAEYFDTTPAYLMGNDMAKEPQKPKEAHKPDTVIEISTKPDPNKISYADFKMAVARHGEIAELIKNETDIEKRHKLLTEYKDLLALINQYIHETSAALDSLKEALNVNLNGDLE